VTLSEPWVVQNWREAVTEAVTQSDLLFGNEDEIMAFTNASDIDEAFARARCIPNVVVTLGPRGVLYSWGEESGKIPATLYSS
jgi:sugar/nucleoside kinase (ribokinase family)